MMMSLSLFMLMYSMISFMMTGSNLATWSLYINFIFMLLNLLGWLWNVISEGLNEGNHVLLMQNSMMLGMIIFILSESLFFISFFSSYFFYSSYSDPVSVSWPPLGLINKVDPIGLPLLGTSILMSSSVTLSVSYYMLLSCRLFWAKFYLFLTILYGWSFVVLQYFEYGLSLFSMNDSVYGSIFFMMTGFHGIHVILGVLGLTICLLRMIIGHFSVLHFLGFKCAILYWHFVDFVWLGLYFFLYSMM